MTEGGRSWGRTIASLAAVIVVGGIVLGLAGWAAMGVLPESDAPDPDTDVVLGDQGAVAADVIETGPAGPDDADASVDVCEVVDDLVQIEGRLRNASGRAQAFVVHVAVLFDGALFDGQTTRVGIATVPAGGEVVWQVPAGSVDPDDPAQQDPECDVDRIDRAEDPAA